MGVALRAVIGAAGVIVLTGAACCFAQPRPDLMVTSGGVAPSPVSVGELVTFSLNVTNSGSAAASQVTLNSTLSSSNATVFGVTVSQGTFSQSGSNAVCSIGSLAVGAGATIRITATPLAMGSVTNSANVTEFETDQNPGNNVITQTVLSVP